MLNLPKSTELNKIIPKKAIYTKFNLDNATKEAIDLDVAKLVIVNELSSEKLHVSKGENVSAIFVLNVMLKRKNFCSRSIELIAKLIPQKMIIVLQYQDEIMLAVYHTKLMYSSWQKIENASININGLDMNGVWKNFVKQIANFEWDESLTIEDNVALNEKRRKLNCEIEKLTRQMNAEKQPNIKMAINDKIKELKKELTDNVG